MNEVVLKLALNDIVSVINEVYPKIKDEKAEKIAKEMLNSINWDNETLMHKGLKWITVEYVKKRGICNAM